MSVETPLRQFNEDRQVDNCDYRDYNAERAGVRAREVKTTGRNNIDAVLAAPSQFEPIVQARARMNAFVLVSGTSGKERGALATASTGIYLGDSKPERLVRAEVLGAIMAGGAKAELKRYGINEDKFLIFIEQDYSPREMARRLVEGPRAIYNSMPELKSKPELGQGFFALQDKREQELLYGDRGQLFEDIFDGRVDPRVSPLVQGKDSLVFGWFNDGKDYIALDPDNEPMGMAKLRVGTPDRDGETDMMLEDKEAFLRGAKGTARWVIEVSGAPDVECCVTSMNSLHFINNFVKTSVTLDMNNDIETLFVYGDEVIARYGNGEHYGTKDFCKNCYAYTRKGDQCSCPKES